MCKIQCGCERSLSLKLVQRSAIIGLAVVVIKRADVADRSRHYSHAAHVSLILRNPSANLSEIADCILMGKFTARYVNSTRRCDGTQGTSSSRAPEGNFNLRLVKVHVVATFEILKFEK
jgi:hypothetical protein